MGILDIMSRIVSILVGLATLAEKSKPYIKRFGGSYTAAFFQLQIYHSILPG